MHPNQITKSNILKYEVLLLVIDYQAILHFLKKYGNDFKGLIYEHMLRTIVSKLLDYPDEWQRIRLMISYLCNLIKP